jgi:TRAP-type C4-dicarboxylate transport system substrate-binding protein
VNEQGKGALALEVIDGLAVANHGNYYDRLLNDVMQISFGTTSTVGGKFKKTNVISLPLLVEKSEPSGVALWRLYKTGMLDGEFDQVVPLMLFIFPPAGVHYRAEPKAIDSLAGLKIIAGSKVVADVASALGGAPVTMPIIEVYQALQRGVGDATLSPYSAFPIYKFAEVTRFHLDVPVTTTPGLVAMSRARYLALPEAARKTIDANATEAESRHYGRYWDREQEAGRRLLEADAANHKIVALPGKVRAQWQKRLAPIEAQWIKDSDGAAVLAKYKELLAAAKAGG